MVSAGGEGLSIEISREEGESWPALCRRTDEASHVVGGTRRPCSREGAWSTRVSRSAIIVSGGGERTSPGSWIDTPAEDVEVGGAGGRCGAGALTRAFLCAARQGPSRLSSGDDPIESPRRSFASWRVSLARPFLRRSGVEHPLLSRPPSPVPYRILPAASAAPAPTSR